MTFREALRRGASRLRDHRCDGADPWREAEALLAFAAGTSRERMLMEPEAPVPPASARKFASLVGRRSRHAPLAYLLGTAWFAGLEFESDRRALIPRPATEQVLLAALHAVIGLRAGLLVDVGTGSGCIAVAASMAMPGAKVVATDSSAAALALARRNARRHHTAVRFLKGDLLRPAAAALSAWRHPAAVIANLPYVPAAARVSPCVRREPGGAVFAPGDGTGPYRKLFRQLAAVKRRAPTAIACELLPAQYAPLAGELRRLFPGATAERVKNHQGRTVGLLGTLEKRE